MLISKEKRVLKALRTNERSVSGREREKIASKEDKNAAAMTLLSKKGSKTFPGIVFERTAKYPVALASVLMPISVNRTEGLTRTNKASAIQAEMTVVSRV